MHVAHSVLESCHLLAGEEESERGGERGGEGGATDGVFCNDDFMGEVRFDERVGRLVRLCGREVALSGGRGRRGEGVGGRGVGEGERRGLHSEGRELTKGSRGRAG